MLRLSLKKLLGGEQEEVDRLFRASCDVGFFYLDLRGAIEGSKRDSAQDLPDAFNEEGKINGEGLLKDAEALFKFAPKVFELPVEEKQKYDYKVSILAYKPFETALIIMTPS